MLLVQDNLTTHTYTAFYNTFAPAVAYALMQQLAMHYTPKGARWLNMAEIQLSVLAKQCPGAFWARRIPTIDALTREVMTWVRLRNQQPVPIHWQFTPEMARDKFQPFYPNLSELR